MTRRNRIIAAIVALVDGATALPTHRARTTPLASAGVLVRPVQETPTSPKTGSEIERSIRVGVSVVVWGTAPDAIADPHCEAIYAAIMADQTIGGLAIRITDGGTSWEIADSDNGPAAEVLSIFDIVYRAPTGSLS